MLKIVTPDTYSEHEYLLCAMCRMRYRVVVGAWGWDIPGIEPGYDRDQLTLMRLSMSLSARQMGTSLEHPGSIPRHVPIC